MDIILLQDVKSVGKKGEKVTVSDAYGRNCIIKKGLGIEATAKNVNDLKLQKANAEKIDKKNHDDAVALAARLKELQVVIKIKAGDNGRIFGSVSTKEISAEAKKQLGLDLDKKKMQLAEPIKSLGNHIVPVKLYKDVTGELTVKVTEA